MKKLLLILLLMSCGSQEECKMILPNYNGDAQTSKMFQLIDEKLSELYAVHGAVTQRGNPILADATSPPVARELNCNSVARAWLFYDGTEHQILNSYNIQKVEWQSAGYYWVYLTTAPTAQYPIIVGNASPGGLPITFNGFLDTTGGSNRITVETRRADGTLIDDYFYMVVFGD